MPATISYAYAIIDDVTDPEDRAQLTRIDLEYEHGQNNMAGAMDEHHVKGPCPFCEHTDSLQFYQDNDSSLNIVPIDARGTYYCHSCESSFIDKAFYDATPVYEYPYPFTIESATHLCDRLQKQVDYTLKAREVFHEGKDQDAEDDMHSILEFLTDTLERSAPGKAATFKFMLDFLREHNIDLDTFMQNLRILLTRPSDIAPLAMLPDNLTGVV